MDNRLPPLDELLNRLKPQSQAETYTSESGYQASQGNPLLPAPIPLTPPLKMNESEYYGIGTYNDIINIRERTDIREKVFEYAKNLNYYSAAQRYTQFWLDVNNTDHPPVTENPTGKDYTSLHPAHKKIVLAGLARIAEANITYEINKANYERSLAEQKKKEEKQRKDDEIFKKEDLHVLGIIGILAGIILGIGAFIYQPKTKDDLLISGTLKVGTGLLMLAGSSAALYSKYYRDTHNNKTQ